MAIEFRVILTSVSCNFVVRCLLFQPHIFYAGFHSAFSNGGATATNSSAKRRA